MHVKVQGKHHYAWSTVVTCGQRTGGGCGAVLAIERDDLFTDMVTVDDGQQAEKVCCLCLSCGSQVEVDAASGFGKLPGKRSWAMHHPRHVEQAHTASRQRDEALGIQRGLWMY
ncbi:MAG: hypothetical protein QY323_05445 [Patescibacteria group bacterium]|nr:MAG: hypothetical protein QY323_05445 [Patescibacteria group bacterium]